MRGEAEMYRLLMDAAEADDRILAVYMNGSRTNVCGAGDRLFY